MLRNFWTEDSPIFLAVDDVNIRRFGKKVFAAGYQYDPATRSVSWSNVLVDMIFIQRGKALACDFALYLPKKYLQRVNSSFRKHLSFLTKIELVTEAVAQLTRQLEVLGVP